MFGLFATLTDIKDDLRELGAAISYTIGLVPPPAPPPVAPPIILQSPLELLAQHAREGNITEFCSRFQSIITQNPPLPQAQFNPNLYINTLLSNIGIYEPKTIIGLKKLLECIDTIDIEPRTPVAIIEKMSNIISTLNPAQQVLLENYEHYAALTSQIAAHKHAIEQQEIDRLVMSAHGTGTLDADDQFVLVGKVVIDTPPQDNTN